MQLTTSWEEAGIKIGLQQGRQEGEVSLLKRLLSRRFGTLSADIAARINAAAPEQIEA